MVPEAPNEGYVKGQVHKPVISATRESETRGSQPLQLRETLCLENRQTNKQTGGVTHLNLHVQINLE